MSADIPRYYDVKCQPTQAARNVVWDGDIAARELARIQRQHDRLDAAIRWLFADCRRSVGTMGPPCSVVTFYAVHFDGACIATANDPIEALFAASEAK